MRNKYLLQRMLILTVLVILFSLCTATLGLVTALQFTSLLLAPILIALIGFYFMGKRLNSKGNYSDLMAISIPALMVFVFSFLGMAFDPRNPSPLGFYNFLISGGVSLGIFLLGLIAVATQKLLNKK